MFSLHPFFLGSCPLPTESPWTDPPGPQFVQWGLGELNEPNMKCLELGMVPECLVTVMSLRSFSSIVYKCADLFTSAGQEDLYFVVSLPPTFSGLCSS